MSKLPLVASIYNPQNQNREQLINSFVVRLNTFKKLFHEIEGAEMKFPEQHYLIVGKRGMGKTTLLLRLSYEIENTPKLNNWLIPLVFNEEEYSIWKLYKFWIRVAELLEDKEENYFYGLSQEIENLWDEYDNDEDYEKAVFEVIANKLKTQKKKIILFIDNVGDMFNKFSDHDAHRLRKILQTSADIRIFAASSKMTESFFKYEHPFYEFFKIEYLKGLNQKETEDLLLQLGETYQQKEKIEDIIKNQKGRVESLRRLTGGVIRTIVLLFEIFVDSKNGSAFSDLEAILDRVTPLYKHRMDDLPKQQQEIVEAIALAWDAMNVKEIKQKTRMESKFISAQLTQLIKNDIVNRIPTSTKNHLYQISERFFNIWYLMRNGKKGDKRKVIWLVRFLEEWCDRPEIIERAIRHINRLNEGHLDGNTAYLSAEAISQIKCLPQDLQHEVITSTRRYLIGKNNENARYLSKSDLELLNLGEDAYDNNEFKKAIKLFLEMQNPNYFGIGLCYQDLENFERAKEYFERALEIEKEDKGTIFYNLGALMEMQNDIDNAIKYYSEAANENDHQAMHRLGHIYDDFKKNAKLSAEYYKESIKYGEEKATQCLIRLFNKYYGWDSALKVALEYASKKNKFAIHELGHLYENKNHLDNQKSEKYFLEAISLGDSNAYSCLGDFYNENGDIDNAEKYYKLGIENDCRTSFSNLIYLYFINKKNKSKSLSEANTLFKNDPNINNAHTLACILLWNNKFDEIPEIEDLFIFDEYFLSENNSDYKKYLLLKIAKERYNELFEIFNNQDAIKLNLKEKFKPIYYALMYYLQDKYPNEYLRMGDELKETVEEIIAEVERLREEYQ